MTVQNWNVSSTPGASGPATDATSTEESATAAPTGKVLLWTDTSSSSEQIISGFSAESNEPALVPPKTTTEDSSIAPEQDANMYADAVSTPSTSQDTASPEVLLEKNYWNVFSAVMIPMGYSPTERAKVQFALAHPDLVTDPTVLNELATVKQAAATQMQSAGVTIPPNWPTGTTFTQAFDKAIGEDNDYKYESAVQSYVAQQVTQQQLTDDQASQLSDKLLSMHFHPELFDPNDPLASVQKGLEASSLNSLQDLWGIPTPVPTSWSPPVDSSDFDINVLAMYRVQNAQNLQDYVQTNNIDADTAQKLQTAISSINNPGYTVPPDLADAVNTILNQSLSAVRGQYGLPETWKATGPGMPTDPNFQMGQNVINDIKSTQTFIQNEANKLPDGPVKLTLLNALKIIGAALSQAEEMLYAIETGNAETSKKTAAAQEEDQQFQIQTREKAEQKERADRAAAEARGQKGGILGKIMKVLAPIMIVVSVLVTVATMGSMGPVAIAISVAFMASSISAEAGKMDFMSKAFQLLGPVFATILRACGVPADKADQFGKVCSEVLVIVAMVYACRGASAGMYLVGGQAVGTSNVGGDLALACGADPKQAMIAGAAIGGTAMAAGGIAAVKSISANSEQLIVELSDELDTISNSINNSTSTMEKIGLYLQKVVKESALKTLNTPTRLATATDLTLKTASAGIGAYSSYNNSVIDSLMADLQDVEANAQKKITELDFQISLLKKLIQAILAPLDTAAEVIADINKLQSKKYQDNATNWAM